MTAAVSRLNTQKSVVVSDNRFLPGNLHYHLSVSPHIDLNLDEKRMRRYRQMLYSINAQGMFRYRTARIPDGLRVWRLK